MVEIFNLMTFRGFKRLRHSHGFGVHSPYAYRFVQSVISPSRKYAYYGEEIIDGLVSKETESHRLEKEAKTLLRLAAFTNPGSVFITDRAHPSYRAALRSVNPGMTITDKTSDIGRSDMVAVRGSLIPLEDLCAYIAEPAHTLLGSDLPSGWVEEIYDSMPTGVFFEGKPN